MKLNAVYALNKEGKRCLLGYEMLAENEQEKDALSWLRGYYFDGSVNYNFEYAGRSSETQTDKTTALKFIVPHNARRMALGLLNECEEGNGERLTFEQIKSIASRDLKNPNVSAHHDGNLEMAFAHYIKYMCSDPDYTIGRMYGWRGLHFEVSKSYFDGTLKRILQGEEVSDYEEQGVVDDVAFFTDRYYNAHVLVNGKAYCLTLLKE